MLGSRCFSILYTSQNGRVVHQPACWAETAHSPQETGRFGIPHPSFPSISFSGYLSRHVELGMSWARPGLPDGECFESVPCHCRLLSKASNSLCLDSLPFPTQNLSQQGPPLIGEWARVYCLSLSDSLNNRKAILPSKSV